LGHGADRPSESHLGPSWPAATAAESRRVSCVSGEPGEAVPWGTFLMAPKAEMGPRGDPQASTDLCSKRQMF
jgi:hypothetical protein